jgi:hypothetical protein
LAPTTPVMAGLLPVSRALPIVFVLVTDPVGSGFVPNLTRPGGRLTGFTAFEGTGRNRPLAVPNPATQTKARP